MMQTNNPNSLRPSALYRQLGQRRQLRRLMDRIAVTRPLKVLVGAGPKRFTGWIETDQELLNISRPHDWSRLFQPASIDRILAEHVVEHLNEAEWRTVLGQCCIYLKPDGIFRVAVPDGFHPDPAYVDAVRPGGSGPGSDDHKILYNYRTFEAIASSEGFECEFLEYFDEQGGFCRRPWNVEDGFVERSENHDPRNKERPLSYTSLIVDLRPTAR
jgi:predicted SAM-dependent methyltransferase